jgi:hypothetical protein
MRLSPTLNAFSLGTVKGTNGIWCRAPFINLSRSRVEIAVSYRLIRIGDVLVVVLGMLLKGKQ